MRDQGRPIGGSRSSPHGLGGVFVKGQVVPVAYAIALSGGIGVECRKVGVEVPWLWSAFGDQLDGFSVGGVGGEGGDEDPGDLASGDGTVAWTTGAALVAKGGEDCADAAVRDGFHVLPCVAAGEDDGVGPVDCVSEGSRAGVTDDRRSPRGEPTCPRFAPHEAAHEVARGERLLDDDPADAVGEAQRR